MNQSYFSLWRIIAAIALRNITRQKRRSALTLFAMTMSVFIVLCVRSTLNGLQDYLKEKVILGQTGALQIHQKGFRHNIKKSPLQMSFEFTPALKQAIVSTPGVEAISARIQFPTMVNAHDTTLFTLAIAIDPINEYHVCPRKKEELGEGGLVVDHGIVLSPELKKQLQLKSQEEVTLLAPDIDGTLNAINLNLSGHMADNPAFSGDKKLALVPLIQAQELLRLESRVTEIAIKIQHIEQSGAVKNALNQVLGEHFEIQDWAELSPFITDAIKNQNAFISIIMTVFMIVAMIGIANTMMMTVLERTKEIGTMMAVGVKRVQIVRLFILESIILGFIGAIIGLSLGALFIVYFQKQGIAVSAPGSNITERIKPVIDFIFIVKTISATLLGAFLAALYPALRASKQSPIQALSSI